MKELKKINIEGFKNIYQEITVVYNKKTFKPVTRKVTCILDDNCVRYTVTENGRKKIRREYDNNQKEACFTDATKALNK